MSTQLLTTKLYAPPVRAGVIQRAPLLARLSAGQEGKLTLISAPAGFGKSTLVSSWVGAQTTAIAWLSLDELDRDPYRLLVYLLAAMRTAVPAFGQSLMTALCGPNPPTVEDATTALINALHGLTQPVAMVLDDLHSAQSDVNNQVFRQLITYLPDHVHIIVTTREEPSLALAKLRAKGDLTEFRVTDLRFTFAEITQYLNESMQLNLSSQGISALETSTEGWIAGLQLAALSLRASVGLNDVLVQLENGHPFIVDYLLEDVLLKQPPQIQQFLLHTAILGRFCAPLCAAVLDANPSFVPEHDSHHDLELIERENLFVIPLDAERTWYRYHHLFAELLRRRLQQQRPDIVPHLHLAASHWFSQQGLDIEAFEHAAAAQDYAAALRIINGGIIPLQFRGGVFPIMAWLQTLPTNVMNQIPALWVTWASSLLALGQVDGVLAKVAAAEHALAQLPAEASSSELRGAMASIRASVAVTQYDHQTILQQAEIALAHLEPANLAARASITWASGFAHALRHELNEAESAYHASLAVCDQIGFVTIGNMCRIGLCEIWLENLQLHQVATIAREVIQQAGEPPPPTTCDAYVALGIVHYYWDELDQAEYFVQQALPMAQRIVNTDRALRCELFLAQIAIASGQLTAAAQQLEQAERSIQQNGFVAQKALLSHLRTRLALKQQNYPAAARWAEGNPQSTDSVLVLALQGDLEGAQQRLNSHVNTEETTRTFIYHHLLRALIHEVSGNGEAAQTFVDQAIALAQTHHALRILLDENSTLTPLRDRVAASTLHPDFVQQLMQRIDGCDTEYHSAASQCPVPLPVQPLGAEHGITKRELDVLRLVADGLSNQEISERLHRSLSTVKGHNKSIFEKLHVKRRTEAIVKARELGLL